MAKVAIKSKCPVCGKSCKRRRKFCGHECRAKFCSKAYICEYCNKAFTRKTWRKSNSKFCCLEHYHAAINRKPKTFKPLVMSCQVCGKTFPIEPREKNIRKYCSHKCRAIGATGQRRKGDWRLCPTCQKQYWTNTSNNRLYCSKECYWQAITGKNAPLYIHGNYNLPYPSEFNNRLRRTIRERDGWMCVICNTPERPSNKKLPIHHIDYDKDNSDPSNLITLCHSCHSTTNTNRDYWQKTLSELQIKRTG